MYQQKKQKRKFVLNFNILLIILIPLVFIGITAAKYIQEKSIELIYQAKAFYFESDFLADNTAPKVYTYEIGNTEIAIELKNSADDLRFSEVDIKYEVEITDVNGNLVKDSNGETLKPVLGELKKDRLDSNIITFSNLHSGTYIITATSIKPYKKTIQATFFISDKDNSIEYHVNDAISSPILQLTVLVKDYEGAVDVVWPSGVAPDTTFSILSGINSGYDGGSTKIYFKANSEYIFQFFKKQPSIKYTDDNFSVGRSG